MTTAGKKAPLGLEAARMNEHLAGLCIGKALEWLQIARVSTYREGFNELGRVPPLTLIAMRIMSVARSV